MYIHVDIKELLRLERHFLRTIYEMEARASEKVFTDADISISGRVFHSRFSDISESGSWERVRADVLHQIKPQPAHFGLNPNPFYLLNLTAFLANIYLFSSGLPPCTCID